MGDLEDAKRLHSRAWHLGGAAGRCAQLDVPWTTYTYTWLSQTDCIAAGFPQREHFKRKEVEAPGVLSLGPESLLPYSDGHTVRKSSQL